MDFSLMPLVPPAYSKALWIVVFLTPLLAPWTLSSSLIVSPDLLKVAFAGLAVWLLGLSYFIGSTSQISNTNKQTAIVASPFYLPIGLFLIWCVISFAWAFSVYVALELFVTWLVSAMMFFIVVNSVHNQIHVKQLLTAVVYAAAVCAFIGIIQHLFGFDWVRQAVPPAATFGNKNLAGHFMVLSLPVCLVLFLLAQSRKTTLKYALCLALIMPFTVYLNSRSSWLAVLLQLLCGGGYLIVARIKYDERLLSNKKALALLAILLWTAVMANATPTGFNNQWTTIIKRITSMTEGKSIGEWNERINIWSNTTALIVDDYHWLYGTGLGNWAIVYPKYFNHNALDSTFSETRQLDKAHNDYLEIFASVGIIGFSLLLWLFYLAVKVCLRILTPVPYTQRYLLLGIALALMGFLVTAFFSFPSRVFLPVFIVMVYLGLLAGVGINTANNATQSNRFIAHYYTVKNGLNKLMVAVLIMAMSAFCYISYRYLAGQHYYAKSVAADSRSDWQHALKWAKLSNYYDPFNDKTRFVLAKSLLTSGDYQQALPLLQVLMSNRPYYMNGLFNLSVVYFNLGNAKQGLNYLYQTLTLYPQFIKANIVLMDWYWFNKQQQEAHEHYQKIKQMVLTQQTDFEHFGDSAEKLGYYQDAYFAYSTVIKRNNNYAPVLAKLGLLLFYRLDKKTQGIQLMSRALKINPNLPEADLIRQTLKR